MGGGGSGEVEWISSQAEDSGNCLVAVAQFERL